MYFYFSCNTCDSINHRTNRHTARAPLKAIRIMYYVRFSQKKRFIRPISIGHFYLRISPPKNYAADMISPISITGKPQDGTSAHAMHNTSHQPIHAYINTPALSPQSTTVAQTRTGPFPNSTYCTCITPETAQQLTSSHARASYTLTK